LFLSICLIAYAYGISFFAGYGSVLHSCVRAPGVTEPRSGLCSCEQRGLPDPVAIGARSEVGVSDTEQFYFPKSFFTEGAGVVMNAELLQVADFHRHIGAEIASEPQLLAGSRERAAVLATTLRAVLAQLQAAGLEGDTLMSRAAMSLEEFSEWLEAHVAADLNLVADAWADRCYLLFGDAVASGIPAARVFAAVHRSNMTKAAARTASGKAVKASGLERPEFRLSGQE
jgi:predicted HAD superfamily Cof-like phosphohydrolase